MKVWTIYDLETGRIKRTGCCPKWMVAQQVHEGEGVIIDVTGDPATQMVVDGELVDKD